MKRNTLIALLLFAGLPTLGMANANIFQPVPRSQTEGQTAGLTVAQTGTPQTGDAPVQEESPKPAAKQKPAPMEELPGGSPVVGQKAPLAIDGKPAAPGRIPEGVHHEAVELWHRMLRAGHQQIGEAPIAPIQSFDISFSARLRTKPGEASNDEDLRFQFLDKNKGYLLAQFEKSRRISLRGPKSDWLFDGKDWTPLSGRTDKESRRELDRWVAIAKNFIALTRPGGVALVDLKHWKLAETTSPRTLLDLGKGRVVVLPRIDLWGEAKDLQWLEVLSPDFQLFDSGIQHAPGVRPQYRALLGLDKQGRIKLAQFQEEVKGTSPTMDGALFVRILDWKLMPSGYHLPRHLETYRAVGPRQFEELPGLDLFLKSRRAAINPKLVPANFEPRMETKKE